MSEISRLFIPSSQILDTDSEVEKFDIVTQELKSAKIDPACLVYAGVEGVPLLKEATWPKRTETFGFSYQEIRSLATAIDRYGSAESNTVLYYAFDMGVVLPAIVTYAENELLRSEDYAEGWVTRPGHTLKSAVRAVVFFPD